MKEALEEEVKERVKAHGWHPDLSGTIATEMLTGEPAKL